MWNNNIGCPSWVAKARGRKQGFIDGYETGYLQAIQIHKGLSEVQKEDKPLLLNLNIIVDKSKRGIKADDFVRTKFEKMGFECDDCRMAGGGHPDFIFRKGKETVYVEVKSPCYGLSINQALWILQNKDKHTILYYVEEAY